MKDRLLRSLNRLRLPVAVVGFYALPALLFSGKNVGNLLWWEVAITAGACILFGLTLWGLAWLFLRDWVRAGSFAVLLSFPTLQYSEIYNRTEPLLSLGGPPRLVYYALVLLAILLLLIALRRVTRHFADTAITYFAIVALLLTVYTGYGITAKALANSGVHVTVGNADLRASSPVPEARKPDIYYLVFDRYTGPAALSESLGFDNGPFLNGLENRGFYVADRSFSNYPVTTPSLASSLNAGELDVSGPVDRTNGLTPFYPLYRQPAVAEFLKKNGYAFTQVGSWWQLSGGSAYADSNPRFAWQVNLPGLQSLRYFQGVFLTGTVFGDAYDRYGDSLFSQFQSHGDTFLAQMDEIERQAREEKGPKFVFAHMLMPHHPLVFNAEGGPADPTLSRDERYLEQLRFTNQRIGQAVDTILKTDPGNPPIIILAADEGEYPKTAQGSDYSVRADDRALRKKTNILAAFYYPDRRYDRLYREITPVNFFRVTFNEFLGTELDLRPDRIRTVRSTAHPLDWVDVTDRVRKDAR